MTDIKETAWWILVIVGVVAFAYDVAWYGAIVVQTYM